VKALTELHGGSVTAHSDGPGWGSTFTIRLPAAPPPSVAPPVQDIGPPPVTNESSRTRVLVVDDHRDVVDGLSRWLETYGCEVQAALTPAHALVLAETFQPNIAILDLGLPVMDGYALAEALRKRLGDAAPVLVALSGYSQPQDRERSRDAGFALHLSKPVDVDQLADALANVEVLRTRSGAG
jgi:CheY-like chemotaxis protein